MKKGKENKGIRGSGTAECPECKGAGGYVTPVDAYMCDYCEGTGKIDRGMICKECGKVCREIEGEGGWLRYCQKCRRFLHPKEFIKEPTQENIDWWIMALAYHMSMRIRDIRREMDILEGMCNAIGNEHSR